MRDLRASGDWQQKVAGVLPPDVADEVPMDLFGVLTGLPAGAEELPWDGPTARILEHRAHTAGHAALLIEEPRVLIAGDMLSDVLVPMLDLSAPDPIGDHLAALELLESIAAKVDAVIPGHGSVGGADELRARIDRDRAYVLALRDGTEIEDPRIGESAEPGWEWVSEVHAGQVQSLARS
jgi:glyoxylase-like metal-dependent hydrolase (beta-lactamase superfamily II)